MPITATASAPPRRALLLAAFAAVYLLWGSTYLAIKYAIATMPPLLMAGSRFLVAGSIMAVAGRLSADYEKPTLAQYKTSLVVGALLLVGGNGGVVLAERYVSSSLAALLIASEPAWIVLLGWLWLRGERPRWPVVLGLALGLVGVYLLVARQLAAGAGAGSHQLLGVGLVLAAALSWATGSIYGLRGAVLRAAGLAAGLQMLAGGTLLVLLGTATGEWRGLALGRISGASGLGWGYLVGGGSLVAFTAYSWLLKHAPPARVATYAYVNPVVAVLLGWAVAGETLTGQMLAGAAVIVASVVLLTTQQQAKAAPAEAG